MFSYPNCTLVTACYDLHKYNTKCRTTAECLNLIDPLLKIPVYLVIYGSKTTIPAIRARRHKYDKITKYIEMELEDLWTYQFLEQVKQNRDKYWPTRDERTCAESHIICCNKFDFLLETITINPFNTTHFGWIDAYLGKASALQGDQKASDPSGTKDPKDLKGDHKALDPSGTKDPKDLKGDQKALDPSGTKDPKDLKGDHKALDPSGTKDPKDLKGDQKALDPSGTKDPKDPKGCQNVSTLPSGTKKESPICEAYTPPICDTLRICEAYTSATVPRILRTIADEWKSDKFHIQILNVCDKKFKDPANKREYYNQYRWIMCGGFFLTAIDAGITILSRLKEIFVETTLAGYGHGEEMFYLEVLDEYSDQIRGTYGDYGQILDNFIYPTQNIEYVYHTIMAKYKEYGYTREANALATQLLEAANKSWVIINDDTYTELAKWLKI